MASRSRGREILFTIRTTETERDWFHAIARAQGMPLSELIRQAVALEGVKVGVPAPTASPAA